MSIPERVFWSRIYLGCAVLNASGVVYCVFAGAPLFLTAANAVCAVWLALIASQFARGPA